MARYINTPSYGGREHVFVAGSLMEYLNCNIRDYNDDDVFTILDLMLEIAWEAVSKEYPRLYGPAFAHEIRTDAGGYIEITFYRRK